MTAAATEPVAARIAAAARLLAGIGEADLAIATTPREAVFRQDKVTLWRFRPPEGGRPCGPPILLCYGLIGRWTVADLQPDRSLVRMLLGRGFDLWVVDWGNPGRAERHLTLDDYVGGYLDRCLAVVAEASGRRPNLLGICEGGVFATCYAALLPARIATLVLVITPIDFHAEAGDREGGRLGRWARSLTADDVDRLVAAHGVLPGALMGSVFAMLRPARNRARHGLALLEAAGDRERLLTFLRMERWLADRPDHPGEAGRQWLRDLYGENRLARNALVLGGRRVDLRRLTAPVLNVFATDDHIVPPATSQALRGLVGGADYSELALPGGHIGIMVGRGRTRLGPAIADWLAAREDHLRT